MPPRRAHTKSRTGCKTCKTRRVKCDELRPICTNCQRRELECVYATAPGSNTPSPEMLPQPAGSLASPLPPHTLDLNTLHLLHHYIMHTTQTLTTHGPTLHVWRSIIPQLGFQHPFVMHGLLALSALHLSYLHPASPGASGPGGSYQTSATLHHHHAITLLRGSIPSRSPTLADPLFAASYLIALFAFITPSVHPSHLSWLPMVRGSMAIVQEFWTAIETGPLGPLLDCGDDNTSQAELPEVINKLAMKAQDEVDADAIDKLGDSWEWWMRPEDVKIACVMQWPILVNQEFVERLKEGRHSALVVLGCYWTMLSARGLDGYWWIEGRARREIQEVDRLVTGAGWDEWRKWVRDTAGREDRAIREARGIGEVAMGGM